MFLVTKAYFFLTREDDKRDQLKKEELSLYQVLRVTRTVTCPWVLYIHIANLYVCVREGTFVDQVVSARVNRTTGRGELEALEERGRRNKPRYEKRGRKVERKREREKRTFPSISI